MLNVLCVSTSILGRREIIIYMIVLYVLLVGTIQVHVCMYMYVYMCTWVV